MSSGRQDAADLPPVVDLQPVVVVSGLPRSGTSLVMRMLAEGGFPVWEDGARRPDLDNPHGYFELERVAALESNPDRSWLQQARGRAIKVISFLLAQLPDDCEYRVVLVTRPIDEVIASQRLMLTRRGQRDSASDPRLREILLRHLDAVRGELARRARAVLELAYPAALGNPLRAAESLHAFLGATLDLERMARAVDPALHRNRSGEAH